MVAPPRHLPTTIDDRRTGATISSRRNPSSRSQTSDAALKMALYTSAMPRTPGNMNVVRPTPSVDESESVCSPGPRTNRNSSGWISHATMPMGSLAKRIRSRRQTVRTARASDRHDRSGTRTATTSATTALIGPTSPARA